jgi:CheY-like chemotaxis protein
MKIFEKTIENVLLIDDSESTNLFHKALIEETFTDVKVACKTSAKEALTFLQNIQGEDQLYPNLIFLDLAMPEGDGLFFLDEYVKMDSSLKPSFDTLIVIVSDHLGFQNFSKTKAYKHLGLMVHHVRKPFIKDDLISIIDEFNES